MLQSGLMVREPSGSITTDPNEKAIIPRTAALKPHASKANWAFPLLMSLFRENLFNASELIAV